MVNCSYCGKEIKRLVFCNASHKTMYHRKLKVISPDKFKLDTDPIIVLCKHGSMKGLCKLGCE